MIALGKSQEVPTKLGHTLFAGVKIGKNISNDKSLDETFKEINDGELKIADHPEAKIGKMGVMMNCKNSKRDCK